MILLDTDHLTAAQLPDESKLPGADRPHEGFPDQQIGTTIISIEEQWRGWFAVIARFKDVRRQVRAYQELVELHAFLSNWTVVPFDVRAADRFEQIRAGGLRIGSMDVKIASIALVHNALLLSANMQDFQKVPGLRVENWLS
jgi:tRNA(fMet)-specific endonuclease VapC